MDVSPLLTATDSEKFLPPVSQDLDKDTKASMEDRERIVCPFGLDIHLTTTVWYNGGKHEYSFNPRVSGAACPRNFTGKTLTLAEYDAVSDDPIKMAKAVEAKTPYDELMYQKHDPRKTSKTVIMRDYACKVPIDVADTQKLAKAVLQHYPNQYVDFLDDFVSNLFGKNMQAFLDKQAAGFQSMLDNPDSLNRIAWGAYMAVQGGVDLTKSPVNAEDKARHLQADCTLAWSSNITTQLGNLTRDGNAMSGMVSSEDLFNLRPCIEQHIAMLKKMSTKFCKGFGSTEQHVVTMLFYANEQGEKMCADLCLMADSDAPSYDKITMQVPINFQFAERDSHTVHSLEPDVNPSIRADLHESERKVSSTPTVSYAVGRWCGNSDPVNVFLQTSNAAPFQWGWGHAANMCHTWVGKRPYRDGSVSDGLSVEDIRDILRELKEYTSVYFDVDNNITSVPRDSGESPKFVAILNEIGWFDITKAPPRGSVTSTFTSLYTLFFTRLYSFMVIIESEKRVITYKEMDDLRREAQNIAWGVTGPTVSGGLAASDPEANTFLNNISAFTNTEIYDVVLVAPHLKYRMDTTKGLLTIDSYGTPGMGFVRNERWGQVFANQLQLQNAVKKDDKVSKKSLRDLVLEEEDEYKGAHESIFREVALPVYHTSEKPYPDNWKEGSHFVHTNTPPQHTVSHCMFSEGIPLIDTKIVTTEIDDINPYLQSNVCVQSDDKGIAFPFKLFAPYKIKRGNIPLKQYMESTFTTKITNESLLKLYTMIVSQLKPELPELISHLNDEGREHRRKFVRDLFAELKKPDNLIMTEFCNTFGHVLEQISASSLMDFLTDFFHCERLSFLAKHDFSTIPASSGDPTVLSFPQMPRFTEENLPNTLHALLMMLIGFSADFFNKYDETSLEIDNFEDYADAFSGLDSADWKGDLPVQTLSAYVVTVMSARWFLRYFYHPTTHNLRSIVDDPLLPGFLRHFEREVSTNSPSDFGTASKTWNFRTVCLGCGQYGGIAPSFVHNETTFVPPTNVIDMSSFGISENSNLYMDDMNVKDTLQREYIKNAMRIVVLQSYLRSTMGMFASALICWDPFECDGSFPELSLELTLEHGTYQEEKLNEAVEFKRDSITFVYKISERRLFMLQHGKELTIERAKEILFEKTYKIMCTRLRTMFGNDSGAKRSLIEKHQYSVYTHRSQLFKENDETFLYAQLKRLKVNKFPSDLMVQNSASLHPLYCFAFNGDNFSQQWSNVSEALKNIYFYPEEKDYSGLTELFTDEKKQKVAILFFSNEDAPNTPFRAADTDAHDPAQMYDSLHRRTDRRSTSNTPFRAVDAVSNDPEQVYDSLQREPVGGRSYTIQANMSYKSYVTFPRVRDCEEAFQYPVTNYQVAPFKALGSFARGKVTPTDKLPHDDLPANVQCLLQKSMTLLPLTEPKDETVTYKGMDSVTYNHNMIRPQFFSVIDAAALLWHAREFVNEADANRPDVTNHDKPGVSAVARTPQPGDAHPWCIGLYNTFMYARQRFLADKPNEVWEAEVKKRPERALPASYIGEFATETWKKYFPLLPNRHPIRQDLRKIRALEYIWGLLPAYRGGDDYTSTSTEAWMPLSMAHQVRLLKSANLYDNAYDVPANPWLAHNDAGISKVFHHSYHSCVRCESKDDRKFKEWVRDACEYQIPVPSSFHPFSYYGGALTKADFQRHRVEKAGKVRPHLHTEMMYNRFGVTTPIRVGTLSQDTGLLQDMFSFKYRPNNNLSKEQLEMGDAEEIYVSNFLSYARNHAILALSSANSVNEASRERIVKNLYRLYVDTYEYMGSKTDSEGVPCIMGFLPHEINTKEDKPIVFYAGTLTCMTSKLDRFCASNARLPSCEPWRMTYLSETAEMFNRFLKKERRKRNRDANWRKTCAKKRKQISKEEFLENVLEVKDYLIDFFFTHTFEFFIEMGVNINDIPLNVFDVREVDVALDESDENVMPSDLVTPNLLDTFKSMNWNTSGLSRKQLCMLSLLPKEHRIFGTLQFNKDTRNVDLQHLRQTVQRSAEKSNENKIKTFFERLGAAAIAASEMEVVGPLELGYNPSDVERPEDVRFAADLVDPLTEAKQVPKRAGVTGRDVSSVMSQSIRSSNMRNQRGPDTLWGKRREELNEMVNFIRTQVEEMHRTENLPRDRCLLRVSKDVRLPKELFNALMAEYKR